MLLEQLAEQAGRSPEYDWEGYYRWLFSRLAGREVSELEFWLCRGCLSVNLVVLPFRHGSCRGCGLIHLPAGPRNRSGRGV